MQTQQEAAVLEWVNKVIKEPPQLISFKTITDYSSILYKIASKIDPKWFKPITAKFNKNNWVLQLNSLKKFYKLMTSYYEQILHQPTKNIPKIDFNMIAQGNSSESFVELLKWVIVMAVSSERNDVFVEIIQSMESDYQLSLMQMIEHAKLILGGVSNSNTNSSNHSMFVDDTQNTLNEEVAQLKAENKRLLIENSLNFSKEGEYEPGTDQVNVAELIQSKSKLALQENKIHDQEQLLDEQRIIITNLRKKSSDSDRSKQELTSLRDQVQDLMHVGERLQKSEILIEKYKKKIEDTTLLKKQFQSLKDQNAELRAVNQELEDTYHSNNQIKMNDENNPDTHVNIELLQSENIKLELAFKTLTLSTNRLTLERESDLDTIQMLQDNVTDLNDAIDHRRDDGNMGIDSELHLLQSDYQNLRQKCERLEVNSNQLEAEVLNLYERNLVLENGHASGSEDRISNGQLQNPELMNKLRVEEAKFNKVMDEKEELHAKWVDTSDKLRRLEIAYQKSNALLELKQNNQDPNTQYATVAKKLIELQGQNKALRNAMEDAKDCIILQDKAIKESKTTYSGEDMFPEALLSYEIMVRDKDFEIQNLKSAFNEFKVIAKREQKLMVGAWYNLTLQSHQKNILNKGGKLDKSSWLAQERLMKKGNSKD